MAHMLLTAMTNKPIAKVNAAALRRWLRTRVAFFKPQERRTEQLNIRSTATVVRKIGALAKVWTIASRASTGDEGVTVAENEAAFRLLESSVDAALAEILGKDTKVPDLDDHAEWARIETLIRKQLKK